MKINHIENTKKFPSQKYPLINGSVEYVKNKGLYTGPLGIQTAIILYDDHIQKISILRKREDLSPTIESLIEGMQNSPQAILVGNRFEIDDYPYSMGHTIRNKLHELQLPFDDQYFGGVNDRSVMLNKNSITVYTFPLNPGEKS